MTGKYLRFAALRFVIGMLAACYALPRPAIAQTGTASECTVPTDLVQDDPLLPATTQKLRAKQPLTILAIGGSSTLGEAAGSVDQAYPRMLELALRRRFPGNDITVVNKGVAGQTSEQMVDRFSRDIVPAAPSLVIWETGTEEAVKGAEVDEFAQTLQSGIAILHAKHIDVMLIDMQFSQDTASVINFEPYLKAMSQVGDVEEAYVFRRFDIMKYWNDNDVFRFDDVEKKDRKALAAKVYACLGDLLANAIVYAARPEE